MAKNIVLCVDDDAVVLRYCSIAIAEAGFRVVIAENGPAGLEAFIQLKTEICLVLTDVLMPYMNGVEMAQQILAMAPEAKILIMTGYTDEIVKLQGGNLELPVIKKPFLAADLRRKLGEVLGYTNTASAS
jgi:CheY-like chemotaxis protein